MGWTQPVARGVTVASMRVGNSWSRDVAVVMVAAAVAELEVWLSSGPRSALAVLVALASLPLLVRRRFPFAAPMLGAAVVAASPLFVRQTLFDGGAAIPVILVAGWSLGRWNDHPRAWAGLGILYVGFLAVILPAAKTGLGDVVYGSMELVAPWFAGRAMRAREAQLETLELRAVQLEGEREQRRRAALAEERLRLARELHDVTAHSISVMTVQAGGARLLLRQDPARAEEALRRVEETGRRTLAEIRRLPDLVGGTANGSSSSLAAVSSLVNEMRDAGLRVELGVEGAVRPLPAGLDLAAFRVVQEALTNTLKHARSASASVHVHYAADELLLEIDDDGTRTDATEGGGHGLVGMRERVGIYGGAFEAGRRPDGGYRVRVRLPLERAVG